MSIKGLTHGFDSDSDSDSSHEYRGHGVSKSWIRERVISGAKSATPKRVASFRKRMESRADKAGRKAHFSEDMKVSRKAKSSQSKYQSAVKASRVGTGPKMAGPKIRMVSDQEQRERVARKWGKK